MKKCTNCNQLLDNDKFRIRKDLNKKTGHVSIYLNSTCKNCDKIKAKEYHNSKKDNDEYKKKNRDRVNKIRIENPEQEKERQKRKRQTDKFKKYVSKYYQENKEHILKLHAPVNSKYMGKVRYERLDMYARIQLTHPRNGLKKEDLTEQLIELKIKKIKSWRLQKQLNN